MLCKANKSIPTAINFKPKMRKQQFIRILQYMRISIYIKWLTELMACNEAKLKGFLQFFLSWIEMSALPK